MKKLLIAAMMVAMSATSFAQNPKIDKEVKAAGSYEAGLKVLDAQKDNLTNEQKAKAYNQLLEFLMPDANKAYEALTLAQAQGQQANIDYFLLVNAINTGVECDKYDSQANDKGKVAPKFRNKNADRLFAFRGPLVNAANQENDSDKKLAYSECIVQSSLSPLFAAKMPPTGDPLVGYGYFFAAYSYYNAKDYKKAAEYAKNVLSNPDLKENAESVYLASISQNMQTKADTIYYIESLKALDAHKYFAQMASMYNRIGEKDLANKILDEEIAANPQNKMAYAIKGENAMNARNWDEAIVNFNKTVEIDPAFTAVWFNLGVCSSSKGFDMNEQFSDKQGKITAENAAKVKAVLAEAKGYYEKVRELDPQYQEIPNWPRQLRMVYNALGETEKAKEITHMLGED